SPDVLIVEGLNVLQPARPRHDGTLGLAISDYFDFSVYVDARSRVIKQWYVSRFLKLKHGSFQVEDSYFHRYSQLDDDEGVKLASEIGVGINRPNDKVNDEPSRCGADLVRPKHADHTIRKVQLRMLGADAHGGEEIVSLRKQLHCVHCCHRHRRVTRIQRR